MTDQSRADRTTVVAVVEEIWRDVLDVPSGYEDATFIELNGQSITAVLIVNRIEEELGVVVDIGELFEDPRLDQFIEHVARLSRESLADR
ncbi:phosphopantetheine-binding protein [Saccharothrix obliqua]|uniref:NRPS peptidyl-carrier protein n=1 Tax=Streptoalloteichus sp. ATCC 53650 TaxID=756733 RepID=K4P182_9PSEU|nr:phosphopantetheine-binding protein [Saccharothrix obliqua]AFV52209.1 NRPS peptidyl-carrier protein [Streptoalloteichus sp. ATCC 53650]MBW4721882.1 hypothetical protein [Saccharothrix obliqua]